MSFTLSQNLFVEYPGTSFTVVKCDDDAVAEEHLQLLLDDPIRALGVAATYDEQCQLSSIAFSTLSQVLVVNIPASHIPHPKGVTKQQHVAKSRCLIQDRLLLNPELPKYAFRMDQVAVALFLDLSARINGGVDMLSVATNASRQSLEALMNAMGGELILNKKNVQLLLFDTPRSPAVNVTERVAFEAWAACRASTLPHMTSRFEQLPRVNTVTFSKVHLAALASISRIADQLETLKPHSVKNDVDLTKQPIIQKGVINLTSERFPTRIKPSRNQVIQIEIEGKQATSQVVGRVRHIDGRNARIAVSGAVQADKILSVTTVGKGRSTNAESTREDIILGILQHETSILSNPFFQALWLPNKRLVWPESKEQRRTPPVHFSPLNASQYAAVQRILSSQDDDRVIMIQGPPGTGKTTVIAASVISHDHANSRMGIWVAAQSNVAVKNIAEKFIKVGFDNFKLLVSKDFHYDWHEHLYEKLGSHVIRSDRFKESIVDASRLLLDCKVILCTLSMFCNPSISVFQRILPVEVIILDEASQIECGNYLPIFHRFQSELSKLVFIGDDKQLPPYGQEDIPGIRSIFEFSHLRRRASMLDTQYRMPHVIGTFISRNVYGGKLFTHHDSKSSKACRFIDVSKGLEVKMGHSWVNREEARVVVKLARLYESKNMSYRILTPYDAQRSCIETQLKAENLAWKDKAFNVDSFQGNEDDHIIVSVVRSHAPGFLKNQRRTNVMLTRFKRSMVVCSNRSFLFGKASKTLVGKLAASINEENWKSGHDVVCGRVEPFA